MTHVSASSPCIIKLIHGRYGEFKTKDQDILTITSLNGELVVKSPCDGVVRYYCAIGNAINQSQQMFDVVPCPHDIEVSGRCGICGIVRAANETGSRDMNLWGLILTMFASKLIIENVDRVHNRKLKLLIDIDGTIVKTTTDVYMPGDPDTIAYFLPEDHSIEVHYSTKKRPHMEEFLQKMTARFELEFFTLGTHSYAGKMEEFIERKVAYIGQVWAMSVGPMAVFVHARPEVFGHLQNAVHLRLPVSSAVGDDYLMRLESVLTGVHECYFNEVDLRNLEPYELLRSGRLPKVWGAMYRGLVPTSWLSASVNHPGAQGTGNTASIAGSSAFDLGVQAPVAETMDVDEDTSAL